MLSRHIASQTQAIRKKMLQPNMLFLLTTLVTLLTTGSEAQLSLVISQLNKFPHGNEFCCPKFNMEC